MKKIFRTHDAKDEDQWYTPRHTVDNNALGIKILYISNKIRKLTNNSSKTVILTNNETYEIFKNSL